MICFGGPLDGQDYIFPPGMFVLEIEVLDPWPPVNMTGDSGDKVESITDGDYVNRERHIYRKHQFMMPISESEGKEWPFYASDDVNLEELLQKVEFICGLSSFFGQNVVEYDNDERISNNPDSADSNS